MILHRVLFNETLFTSGISQLFLTTCTHPRLLTLIKTLNSNITSEMKEKPNMPKGLIDFKVRLVILLMKFIFFHFLQELS